MKNTTFASFLLLLSFVTAFGFASGYVVKPCGISRRTNTARKNAVRDEIRNELSDLGENIKHHSLSKPAGFDAEFPESTLLELKHEMRDKDLQYHAAIKELQEQVAGLAFILETEENVLRAEEAELKEEISTYAKEHNSVRLLLAEAAKLVARRVARRVNGVLCFLRLKKRKH
jgi:hypothetical protein